MAERQPFASFEQLLEEAERLWWSLGREDWLEAYRSHPGIGEKISEKAGDDSASRWSQQEQWGARGASPQVLSELAEANRAYREKFGCIFIVCATGKTAEEMLALLRARLQNEPDTEAPIAAQEQDRITRLRLEKLLQP